ATRVHRLLHDHRGAGRGRRDRRPWHRRRLRRWPTHRYRDHRCSGHRTVSPISKEDRPVTDTTGSPEEQTPAPPSPDTVAENPWGRVDANGDVFLRTANGE